MLGGAVNHLRSLAAVRQETLLLGISRYDRSSEIFSWPPIEAKRPAHGGPGLDGKLRYFLGALYGSILYGSTVPSLPVEGFTLPLAL